MMQLSVTPRAITDLSEILDYIQQQNPSAAIDIEQGFWREFDFLCEFPNTGHVRKDAGGSRYRFQCLKSYVICYRIEDHKLRILRILHGARDFRQIEFE